MSESSDHVALAAKVSLYVNFCGCYVYLSLESDMIVGYPVGGGFVYNL